MSRQRRAKREENPGDPTPDPPRLFRGGFRRIADYTPATVAMLLAGVVVASVDIVRSLDPVPVVEYAGLKTGNVEVVLGPLVSITSRAGVDPLALQDLRPQWMAWTLGLELLELVAVVAAVTYAVGGMMGRRPTASATVRYGVLLALVTSIALALDVRVTTRFLPGLVLLVALAYVTVPLFALPGQIVAGRSIPSAILRSWLLSSGYVHRLFSVGVLLGILDHLAASVPLVGPVGSAGVGTLHAGVLVAFLDRAGGDGNDHRDDDCDRSTRPVPW